jgi:hypothetical protein
LRLHRDQFSACHPHVPPHQRRFLSERRKPHSIGPAASRVLIRRHTCGGDGASNHQSHCLTANSTSLCPISPRQDIRQSVSQGESSPNQFSACCPHVPPRQQQFLSERRKPHSILANMQDVDDRAPPSAWLITHRNTLGAATRAGMVIRVGRKAQKRLKSSIFGPNRLIRPQTSRRTPRADASIAFVAFQSIALPVVRKLLARVRRVPLARHADQQRQECWSGGTHAAAILHSGDHQELPIDELMHQTIKRHDTYVSAPLNQNGGHVTSGPPYSSIRSGIQAVGNTPFGEVVT